MTTPRAEKYFKTILDAMPSPVFIVDNDVRIIDFNEAACALLGKNPAQALTKRSGEALHCLHADDAPEGCGRAEFCRNCVIRNSVTKSFDGDKVTRRATRMNLRHGGRVREIYCLVTTSRFTYRSRPYVLLTLEDISELMELRSVLPICASCKKIRNDEEYWQHLEAYFKEHWDLDFSHGICPQCLEKLYPDLYAKLPDSEK